MFSNVYTTGVSPTTVGPTDTRTSVFQEDPSKSTSKFSSLPTSVQYGHSRPSSKQNTSCENGINPDPDAIDLHKNLAKKYGESNIDFNESSSSENSYLTNVFWINDFGKKENRYEYKFLKSEDGTWHIGAKYYKDKENKFKSIFGNASIESLEKGNSRLEKLLARKIKEYSSKCESKDGIDLRFEDRIKRKEQQRRHFHNWRNDWMSDKSDQSTGGLMTENSMMGNSIISVGA
ncbi:uncharacterized protein I206_104263 [Kwoniella pini CBS 10737]|uniref:Uncharacterized protein n=1 Tax=Kwoniella pini CBS 10737 TaxID=1296096 RepID=A0A1B9I281_9TREE|nr:uncharacterized protein I206_04161 [Kwoniella pini CBS 10737]OCF49639.1 hypothetical protein I206_04161 [Kwoniella pini CBS 10737]